jgi:hypothetical protein
MTGGQTTHTTKPETLFLFLYPKEAEMLHQKYFISIVLMLVVLLAACSSAIQPAPTLTPMLFPYGTYVDEAGNLKLILNSNGRMTIAYTGAGGDLAYAKFGVNGNEVNWTTYNDCFAEKALATYTWSYENNILLFKVKGNDFCFTRKATIEDVKWIPQQ